MSPYIDVVIIIPYIKKNIVIFSLINKKNCGTKAAGNAQKASIVVDRPIRIVTVCVNLICGHISVEGHVR